MSKEKIAEAGKQFGVSLFAGVAGGVISSQKSRVSVNGVEIGIAVFAAWTLAVLSWLVFDYFSDN